MSDRLLLVKLADIGDLVTATPAIAAAAASSSEISILTTPHAAPMLAGLGGVEVLEFPKAIFDRTAGLDARAALLAGRLALDLRRRSFDRVAILHHLTTRAGAAKYRALALATGAGTVAGLDNGRGGFLTRRAADDGFGAVGETEYMLRVVEALDIPRGADVTPRVWPDPIQLSAGRARAHAISAGAFIAVHPGTGPAAPARLWPAEHIAALIVGLRRQTDLPVVLVGGDGDAIMAARVQALLDEPVAAAVGGMRLGEVAGLLGEAAVFVGADSGLLHVASAMGAPAVGLYGPTDPRAWAPAAPAVTVVKSPVACSPCLYQRGRPPLQIACAEPFCMHAVHPRDVVTAVLDALPRAA